MLKKIVFLLVGAAIALLIDGAMTYDILESNPENLQTWLIVGLILLLAFIIHCADSVKKHPHPDNQE